MLRRIAKPLGLDEYELFNLAGFLSPRSSGVAEATPNYSESRVDSYVTAVLSQEPIEVQRAIVGILIVLKSIAKALK